MDLKDVSKDLTKQTAYRLEQRFLRLLRTNPRYKNLDAGNRDLILDLLDKYKDKLRHGIRPSRLTIKKDMYRLYRNRLELKLTYNDLDQIRDLLEEFK
ncbi:MAG: hypothetical protein WC545_02345 [Patescibacteria group bacterium]